MNKFNMDRFPISFWNTIGFDMYGPETVDMWKDLGITLGVLPETKPDEKEAALAILDKAHSCGIKVLVKDYRTAFMTYLEKGREEFRKGAAEAVEDFGGHPAVFGFFIGDEPNASQSDAAFSAAAIVKELAPELTPFLNFYPWNPVYGPDMAGFLQVESFEAYLDRYVKEASPSMFSYDCYSQCIGESRRESAENHGFDDYFHNLHKYFEASLRYGIPFNTCLCSFEHGWTRCDRDDLRWQLSTAVASGASSVTWFIIQLAWVMDNWRNTAINQAGQRTEVFGWLSEANCVFNDYCGKIMPQLTIDACYHVNCSFGGFPLFEPFGNILNVTCRDVQKKNDLPAVISRFHDGSGRVYYAFCCIGESKWADAAISLKPGTRLERCQINNRFEPVGLQTDLVTQKVLDGQNSELLRISTYTGQFLLFRES